MTKSKTLQHMFYMFIFCTLFLAFPAYAEETGPGSDGNITIVETADISVPSRVIQAGTGPASSVSTTPPGSSVSQPEDPVYIQGASLGMFETTGYCNCESCSSGFSLTYSGTVPRARHTISADLTLYPIGTKLMIDGIVYTVEDKGSSVVGNCVDIFYDRHDDAVSHGRKTQEVFMVLE